MRRCSTCHEVKDVETEFWRAKGEPLDREYTCKSCKRAFLARLHQRRMRDPATRAELRRKGRERQKRRWQRIKADPERHRRFKEHRRMDDKLRRARKGALTRKVSRTPSDRKHPPLLPAKPFAQYVVAYVDRRVNDPDGGCSHLGACQSIGIDDRTVRAYRADQYKWVRFGVVDKVLTATGASWEDIWSKAEYPEVHERLNG